MTSKAQLPPVADVSVSLPGLTSFHNALLNKFEDFFTSGEITSKVSHHLNNVVTSYYFPPPPPCQEEEEEEEGEPEQEEVKKSECSSPASPHDHKGAQENYGKFLLFADFIDSLVTEFVEKPELLKTLPAAFEEEGEEGEEEEGEKQNEKKEIKLTSDYLLTKVAELCNALVDAPEAASFVSVPYIASALEFERFEDLVFETREMNDFNTTTAPPSTGSEKSSSSSSATVASAAVTN